MEKVQWWERHQAYTPIFSLQNILWPGALQTSSNPVLLWHFFCAFHCSHPLYPSKSRRPVSSPPIRTALFKCPANQGARCRARAKFVAGPNINTCRFIRESWVKPMLLSLTLVKLLYLHLAVSNSLSLSVRGCYHLL